MKLHDLRPAEGSTHTTKRVGRGHGSGKGKTSGKGMMGQKARSGPGPYRTFEGGQNRLVKRMPFKRGFTNIYRLEFETVNVSELAQFETGSQVGHEELLAARLVRRKRRPVKILGDGELSVALNVSAHQFSASARAKIEAAGGSVTELSLVEYKVRRSRSRGFNGGGPKKTS